MTSFNTVSHQAVSFAAALVFAGLALCAALPVVPVV